MIIGIDASRANKDHRTGVEWYSYYLIRWLAKLDQENQYILYTNKPLRNGLLDLSTCQYNRQTDEALEIKFDKDGFQSIKSPYNNFRGKVLGWPLAKFWTQGRLSLEMLFHSPDILFVPAHTLPLIHPRRSMVTIHDVGFKTVRNLYESEEIINDNIKLNKLCNILVQIFTLGKYKANSLDYYNWSTEFALKKAKKIITISNFSKQEINNFYKINSEKIKVIHNGYNKFLFKHINDNEQIKKVLAQYGIEGPYLFYVGRIEKKKNIPALIEAFAIMREKNKEIKHKLVLVGDASFGYDETNYVIREYRLDNEVIMPGWVEEEHLPYFYSGATAFIFPSKYEGFGIPLLQAMACAAPIATSKCASIPEIVGEAALFFNPDDINSISAAMERMIKDKTLREKLISLGKDQVVNFSWEKCAKETLAEIKSLIA